MSHNTSYSILRLGLWRSWGSRRLNIMIRSISLRIALAPLGSLTVFLSGRFAPAWAQAPLNGSNGALNMINTDLAVLEAQDVRKDLPCTVAPSKPVLGFDLRFHAGYEVNVPLKELSGSENKLTILFRVTSDSHKEDPVYFFHHVQLPSTSAE